MWFVILSLTQENSDSFNHPKTKISSNLIGNENLVTDILQRLWTKTKIVNSNILTLYELKKSSLKVTKQDHYRIRSSKRTRYQNKMRSFHILLAFEFLLLNFSDIFVWWIAISKIWLLKKCTHLETMLEPLYTSLA